MVQSDTMVQKKGLLWTSRRFSGTLACNLLTSLFPQKIPFVSSQMVHSASCELIWNEAFTLNVLCIHFHLSPPATGLVHWPARISEIHWHPEPVALATCACYSGTAGGDSPCGRSIWRKNSGGSAKSSRQLISIFITRDSHTSSEKQISLKSEKLARETRSQ